MAYAQNNREVIEMPGRDGTGPLGTGAGRFLCRGLGTGLRCGRDGLYDPFEVDEKELLTAQKDILERRLKSVNKQLDKLQGGE
jgi:hypothetical protein